MRRVITCLRDLLPKSWQIPIKFWINTAQGKLEPELKLLPYILRKGDLAIDIGANRGVYTFKLRRIGVAVQAFEPNPACASLLKEWGKNDPDLTVYTVALSDQLCIGKLLIPIDNKGAEHDSSASIASPGFARSRSIAIPIATLDGFGISKISFIKIDVEGAELNVLQGAMDTLRDSRPALLIEIERRHANHSFTATFNLLQDQGYRSYFFDSGILRPIDEFDVDRDQPLENLGVHNSKYINNFLFLHDTRLKEGYYVQLFRRWAQP